MGKPKVLLIGKLDHAHDEWNAVGDVAELVQVKSTNRADFINEAKSGAFEGVVAAFRSFTSATITGRFDEEILSVMPKSFKFLAQNGAGYDPIDVPACTAHEVRICNVPLIADDATADTALFLILGALRGFNKVILACREGQFKGPTPPLGHDPRGKTLGILGMGGIGRNMAAKARAFGMKIQYYNRKQLSDDLSGGAKYVTFDELLATSDVLSLNLPLNPHTRHIISTAEFEKMKDGIVVVNTARGPVMDEEALVKALESGKVWSCGLDVYEKEPEVHPGLLANPHVLLLPHVGTMTSETQKAMEIYSINNVRAAVEKGKMNAIVPEQEGKGW